MILVDGYGAIFRVTNAGDNEATVGPTEIVEFGPNALQPNALGRLGNLPLEFEIQNGIIENAIPSSADSPSSGVLAEVQHVGAFHQIVPIYGYFTDRSILNGPVNLFNFATQNQEPTDFPNGNIGFRLDTFSLFDLTPSAAFGYYIHNLKFILEPRLRSPIGFYCLLKRGKGA